MTAALKCLAFASLLAALSPAAARATELMTGEQLRADFDGHSITGYYLYNQVAFVEVYLPGGGIDYKDTVGSDAGKWSISGATFCTFYDHTPGACWYVVKEQADCYEFYDAAEVGSETATLATVLGHPARARAARDGGKLTCAPWVGT